MYTRLPGLKVEDYEFPGEKGAFQALKKIPYIDTLMGQYLKLHLQTRVYPEIIGDCYRVTQKTCPQLFSLYQTALDRLDVQEIPFYIKTDFEYNACLYGGAKPLLQINSSIVDNFDEEELLYVIGHELGHMKSGHAIYHNLATMFNQLLSSIPYVGMQAAFGVHFALMMWFRMAECTADRAGVIAAGGIEPAISGLGKLMGVDQRISTVSISTSQLIQQNDSFENDNSDVVTKLMCMLELANSSHPWSVTRIKEIYNWEESGEFDALLEKYDLM